MICGLFVLGLIFRIKGKLPGLTSYIPSLLTTLGILGTFIGIVDGLMGFDTTHIDKSIGPLLEGLKTAFVTSIFGMTGAIIFNVLAKVFISEKATPGQIGANELHKVR